MLIKALGLDKYDYYKEPDGKDILGKVLGLGKHTLKVSILLGVADVMCSQTKTVWSGLNRMGFWFIPLNAMSFAFSTITYMSTNIRGKNDAINYAIGSLGPTAVVHAWIKRSYVTYSAFPIFMLAAISFKTFESADVPPFSTSPMPETYITRSYEDPLAYYFAREKDPRPWKN